MAEVVQLLDSVRRLDPQGAANLLAPCSDREIATILGQLNPAAAVEVLERFEETRRLAIETATVGGTQEWELRLGFDEGTVGRLMEPAPAVFAPSALVSSVVEQLRSVVTRKLVTYIFVVEHGKLLGIVTFRDLLYAAQDAQLSAVMLQNPFFLEPQMRLQTAMKAVVTKHFPVYPVCTPDGRLLGSVRGQILFEQQAFEISAQAGSMVGVEKEERLATAWPRAFKFRHPWLQINLLTAFSAGAVVAFFQGTIDEIVVLATFLPILAGQSGNTGCQALAVTIRGMTLGELVPGRTAALVAKEALLGFMNGAVIGIIAGVAMWFYASGQGRADAIALGVITWAAMVLSCVVSGVAGASIPLVLKRLGFDPATASSIFLTTATDVASMGFFLGLAAAFLT